MLGLKLPTDPRWVNIAEKNIEEILTDHAFCEQKATSTAISLIVSFPEYSELVEAMVALVKEEISHFKMVHDRILARGWKLGRDRKDEYVSKLLKFFPKGGSRTTQLVHRLLYAALIEARSCERFKLLSENIKDQELATFYKNLMVSEAFSQDLLDTQGAMRSVLREGIAQGVPMLAFSSTLQYFDAYRTGRLPLNVVQAQRDYFGSHTYERVDREGAFHTEW